MTEIHVRLDATEAQTHLFHVRGKAFTDVRIGQILPATEVQTKLNGKLCTAFKLTGKSILYEYAECKNHVSSLKIENLSVPKTKQTYTTIMLRTYIYSRIVRIMRPKAKAAKTIVIDTLIQKCNFSEKCKDKKFRSDLFKQLKQYLEFLVQQQVISSYKLVAKRSKINDATTLLECEKITFT